MSTRFDVIVLGLGGMGSAALAHLALRGKRVLGLERFSPAHSLGSSHGQSRVIRQAYFEDPAYVPLLLRAYELWFDLERRTGKQLYLRTGGLMAGHPGSQVVEGSARSAREHGLRHEWLSASEIRSRFPALRPKDEEVALFEYEAGVLFPEEAIRAHLQVAVHHGAEARFGTQVLAWEPRPGGGIQVSTSAGTLQGERLILTAGAWLGQLAPGLGPRLRIERNVQHWFAASASLAHLQPDRCPVWILQRKDTPLFYGFPNLEGQGVKVALHHSGHYTTTADDLDRTVTTQEAGAMRGLLADWIPDAAGEVRSSAVCMYTNTPDEHFVIGPHPSHSDIILAGGFSGHGYKFCSVVGEVLADLATQGATPHPIQLFDPRRFRP
jgi:monomeric sarcosine oxidase